MGAILSAAAAVLKGIPFKAWLMLSVVLALAYAQWRVYEVGYGRGAAHVQVQFDQWKANQAEANAKALAQEIAAAALTARSIAGILAGAADRIAEAKAKTQTITREVTRVVESHPELRRCPIPDDLRRLRREQVEASRAAYVRAGEGS